MAGRPTNEPANYFAFGFQSAKDTEATTFTFLKHLDGTGLDLEEEIQREREGGDGQEVGLVYKSGVQLDGQGVAYARAEYVGRIMAAVLGDDQVGAASGVASEAANIHTANPTSTIPYLTVEQYYADQIERVSNAQITDVSIEMEAGRPWKVTHTLVGGGTPYRRDVASALTPARESVAAAFFPGGSYVIDGAANSKLTKAKIDIKRGVDADIRTTSLHREDVVALNFDVDLEFTLKYEDKALYDKIHYGSGSYIPIDLSTGAFQAFSAMGAGTNSRFFEVGLPVFDYIGAKLNKLDPDGKTVYLDVVAAGVKGATHQIYTNTQVATVAAFV